MIGAKVIADSQNEFGDRITTMVVTMPRIILAEFNTHRMFSRNSASSRAISFAKMVKSVEENPFIPIAWQQEHKGMQGSNYITNDDHIKVCIEDWLEARNNAIELAKRLNDGFSEGEDCVTKQLCNRLLEPFMWHTVIVTATEWENFFALRCSQYNINGDIFRSKKDALIKYPKDVKYINILDWLTINEGQAEIHMMALAEAMWDALNESEPKKLKAGEWHIPFGDDIDDIKLLSIIDNYNTSEYQEEKLQKAKIKIATARCARISYTIVGEEGKEPNYENDIKLHDNLAKAGHWSPFEHCARVMGESEYLLGYNFDLEANMLHPKYQGWLGNFKGFIQYRKMFDNENITK